jgi:hypothetical protein
LPSSQCWHNELLVVLRHVLAFDITVAEDCCLMQPDGMGMPFGVKYRYKFVRSSRGKAVAVEDESPANAGSLHVACFSRIGLQY